MPSFARNRSPSPSAFLHAPSLFNSSGFSGSKAVGFPDGSPITSISRPLSDTEAWTLYYFETHARACPSCHDPLRVHRSHGRLCPSGHALAQDVARLVYRKSNGTEAYAVGDSDALVRVEVPRSYVDVKSLLRAMERSLRKRQTPIISYDRNYYVPARGHATPQLSSSPPRRSHSHRHSSFNVHEQSDSHSHRKPHRSHSTARHESPSKSHSRRHHRDSSDPITQGLASLAVRSQNSDLSSNDSGHERNTTKASRRQSSYTPSSSYTTDVRRPAGAAARDQHLRYLV